MPKARRSLYVDVPNTDERLIDWLVETFGGSKIINLDARPNRKTLYRWRAYKKDATAFLLAVTPYLVLKRDLAIEAVR